MSEERTVETVEATPDEIDAEAVDRVVGHVEAGQRDEALALLADRHSSELATLLHHIHPEDARVLFQWLPAKRAADVLPELDEDYLNDLLSGFAARDIGQLVDSLDTDDAADVLGDLPPSVVEKVLPRLEDAKEVGELLEYGEETAGGLMEADYVAVRHDSTVAEATEEVRRLAEEVDPVYAVYVVDDADRLVGIVPLKRLLLFPAGTRVDSIMLSDFVAVEPHTDQEEVALLMERRDLTVLPVVAPGGELIGRITIDDIVDVIRDEVEEDMQRMSGIAGDEGFTDSVLKISRGRLVWLLVGLFGASLSALVINGFEEAIQEAVVLAVFIPVVMAMAGNAGMQSSAIAVQGLATGELWTSDIGKRLGKELMVAVVNGVPLALVLGLATMGMQRFGILGIGAEQAGRLAVTLAFALMAVVALSATVGATVPLVLDRFEIDPALATGPFVTTSNDILGLVVYFAIATGFYLS